MMSEQPERIFFYDLIPDRHMYFSPIAPKDKPMNERDTHFKKFSELLAYRIGTYYDFYTPPSMLSGEFVNGLEKLLAQAAYDFAVHIRNDAPITEWEWEVKDIPDMKEWPEKPDDGLRNPS